MRESYAEHLTRVDKSGMHKKAARVKRLALSLFREEWVRDTMRTLIDESDCLAWPSEKVRERAGRRIPHYDAVLIWDAAVEKHGEFYPKDPSREGAVSDWKTAVVVREIGESLLVRMTAAAKEKGSAAYSELESLSPDLARFVVSTIFVVWVDDEEKNGSVALRLVV